jgi:ABC-type lipoprotein export system ATPase subunit
MNIMGLLDNPTSGSLCIDGTDVTSLGATQSALFRNRAIGFVFQAYYLLPDSRC